MKKQILRSREFTYMRRTLNFYKYYNINYERDKKINMNYIQ